MPSVSKHAQSVKFKLLNNTKPLKVDELIRMYNGRKGSNIITGISVNMNSGVNTRKPAQKLTEESIKHNSRYS